MPLEWAFRQEFKFGTQAHNLSKNPHFMRVFGILKVFI